MKLESSELIVNNDGSIYHLNLKPDEIADDIILVGDPGRVEIVSSFFEKIELKKQNREFVTHTGYFNNKRLTVISSGIGTDNIDIVINELDALVNIDLNKREIKKEHRSLNFIRIGTSGALQSDIPVDSFLLSEYAIGFDGLLNFYNGRDIISELDFEKEFIRYVDWNNKLTAPYTVECSKALKEKFNIDHIISGVTISAPGFYGPQGRQLRLQPSDNALNNKIETFRYNNYKITNYEMESSAIYGLSKLLGHQALTICAIIANRVTKSYSEDYHTVIIKLIKLVLTTITK